MSDYIVHKAVELKNVNKKKRELLSAPGYLETNYIAQPKHDGCNTVFIKDGAKMYRIYSRTGEVVKSMEHIMAAMDLFPLAIPDGVYLGEAWAHDLTFPEISGRFRKQSTTEKTAQLQLVIFDYLTLGEWLDGNSDIGYAARVARLPDFMFSIDPASAPFTMLRSFGFMRETWGKAEAQDIANKLVAAGGYDGLILRDPDGKWIKGDNGSNGEIIKVKPLIRVSCKVTGYELGKGKHTGHVGTLVVEYKGKKQGAGTGLKDAQRLVANFERDWLNQIVEIEALGETEDGQLREPRLLGIRTDVVDPD